MAPKTPIPSFAFQFYAFKASEIFILYESQNEKYKYIPKTPRKIKPAKILFDQSQESSIYFFACLSDKSHAYVSPVVFSEAGAGRILLANIITTMLNKNKTPVA